MTNATTIRIQTIDGQEHEFEMPRRADDGTEYTAGSRIEKMLHQQSIALALEDRLLVIPMQQIKSIEIYPLHHKLPEKAVPNVVAIRTPLSEYPYQNGDNVSASPTC